MTKGKIENAFARLDRLALGNDGEGMADAQESMRRAELFTSVTSALPESIPY